MKSRSKIIPIKQPESKQTDATCCHDVKNHEPTRNLNKVGQLEERVHSKAVSE
jgi:hypothetical protein